MAPSTKTNVRATRFPLRLPLRYRRQGTAEWHSGRCENVSCSGILFRARNGLEPSAKVEVMLRVPPQLCGAADVTLLCTGAVVRTTTPSGWFSSPRAAVAFSGFQLAAPQAASEPLAAGRPIDNQATSSIAHRINNHLMVVMGTCELMLARTDLAPDVRPALEQLSASAGEVSTLFRQLRGR